MLKEIFAAFKYARKLNEISKKISAPISEVKDVDVYMKQLHEKTKFREELYDLCIENGNRTGLLAEYNAGRKELDALYSLLVQNGAGQWIRRRYVVAASLYYTDTLRYLLQLMHGPDRTNADTWAYASIRLIQYFGKGEIGVVED